MGRQKSAAQLDHEIAVALGDHHSWSGSAIQSLLFPRESWTASTAKAWAKKHGYRAYKTDITDNYIRLRQHDPIHGRQKRTIPFGQGIRAIVEER